VGLANLGSESETCVGSRVRLVGVPISFEKNFYRLPFTPPLSGSPYRSFRLSGWGLPHYHFETDILNLFESQPEEIPEVKYPESYQAMFGGILGTMHYTNEGVEFAYFNHRSKAFERVKISPAHTHLVIQWKGKLLFHLKHRLLSGS
jgi:hypothetical protein